MQLAIELDEKSYDSSGDFGSDGEYHSWLKDQWLLFEVARILVGNCYREDHLCKIVHLTSNALEEEVQAILRGLVEQGIVEAVKFRHDTKYRFKKGASMRVQITAP